MKILVIPEFENEVPYAENLLQVLSTLGPTLLDARIIGTSMDYSYNLSPVTNFTLKYSSSTNSATPSVRVWRSPATTAEYAMLFEQSGGGTIALSIGGEGQIPTPQTQPKKPAPTQTLWTKRQLDL